MSNRQLENKFRTNEVDFVIQLVTRPVYQYIYDLNNGFNYREFKKRKIRSLELVDNAILSNILRCSDSNINKIRNVSINRQIDVCLVNELI